MSKLSLRGLAVRFPDQGGTGGERAVLEGIDLEVREGEFLCILGPSGCGKSTLLNVVAGFLPATAGQVLIDGQPVRGPDPRRIFVFQERGLFPWLTVAGNIGFGLFGRSAAERAQIVDRCVALVGLGGFEDAYPHELSGGMKQRVEVARALAVNPDVLYLDEPFGALDFLTRLTMRRELLRLFQIERKTIVFVTHDIEEALQLSDRVVVLSQRPATIKTIIDVDLPHPRDLSGARYLALREVIFAALGVRGQV